MNKVLLTGATWDIYYLIDLRTRKIVKMIDNDQYQLQQEILDIYNDDPALYQNLEVTQAVKYQVME